MAHEKQVEQQGHAPVIKTEPKAFDSCQTCIPVGVFADSMSFEMDGQDATLKKKILLTDDMKFPLTQKSNAIKTEPTLYEVSEPGLQRTVLVNSQPFEANTSPTDQISDAGEADEYSFNFSVEVNVDEGIGSVTASSPLGDAENDTIDQPMDAEAAVKTEPSDSGYEELHRDAQESSLSVDNLPVFFGGWLLRQNDTGTDLHCTADECAAGKDKEKKQEPAVSTKRRGGTGLRQKSDVKQGRGTSERRSSLRQNCQTRQGRRTEGREKLRQCLVQEGKRAVTKARQLGRQKETPEQRQTQRAAEALAKNSRQQKVKQGQNLAQKAVVRRRHNQNPEQTNASEELQPKRQGENPEQEQARKAAQAAAKREKRKYLSEEQKRIQAERARIRRRHQTPEQKKVQAERARIRRQHQTPEQKLAIAIASKIRRQNQTAEQKLAKAEAARIRRQNQTPEKKKALAEAKRLQRQRRALEQTGTDKPKRKRKPRTISEEPSKPKYMCDLCHAVFQNSKSLTTHKYIHTGFHIPDRTFKCRFCGVGFSDPVSCNEHLQDNHREQCPFLCQVCGQVFFLSESFKIHMRRHSGERPYTCHVCGASFTIASSLNNHSRIHTGEKPYRCSVCEKSFRFSSALTTHMRSHTNEAPYACQICGVRYKYASELHKHHRKGHLQRTESASSNKSRLKSMKGSFKQANSDKT